MALFVIADLHLSLGTDKPMDVFPGWQDYTQRLADNWRSLVSPQDTVIIAGDISWAMKLEDCTADFAFIHSLPGEKLLMKGNHDYWWGTRNKIDTFLMENKFYSMHILHNCGYRVGNRAICGTRGWLYNSETAEDRKIVSREAGRLLASMEQAKSLGGKLTAFLHYPPIYGGMECQKILDILVENQVSDCYFGHIHGRYAAQKALTGDYQGIKMHLISCDYVGFCPVLVE
ncbi:serine/threonine protein phosphatase [Acutalibacter sp. 1XD8-33]|uniref:metallophosphoesterase n=1 Tax=Acutalibacter sp. 1XD8-33 TaxID=2320081 RepID=UPI000EA2D62F|nr:metallophosphoesterase [Acutalibacter sp. 1XD8-33]RKJ40436.1 serine/threonine protein phosphatase [Acutalibacter sp. 1XD8-33]